VTLKQIMLECLWGRCALRARVRFRYFGVAFGGIDALAHVAHF
jgi:hypothetical protein